MNNLPLELNNAIEQLYRTFSRYQLKNFSGCSHCVSKGESNYLQTNSLRGLDGNVFSRYTFKAMTTWGDENDFRYFLPRILELVAFNDLDYDCAIVIGKLEYAKWLTWNEKEQFAVKNYFQELMKYTVEFYEEQAYRTSDYFCNIARVVDDVTPYLNLWLEPPTENRISTLRYFVVEDEYGSSKSFIADKLQQRRQIVDWLTQPQTIEMLENLFFFDEKFRDSAKLAELIDAIVNLKQSA